MWGQQGTGNLIMAYGLKSGVIYISLADLNAQNILGWSVSLTGLSAVNCKYEVMGSSP